MDEGESRLRKSFSAQGYMVLPRFLADYEIGGLEARLSRDTGALTGSRALLELPWCMSLAMRIRGDSRLSSVLPIGSRAVLCTYFEKSPARNWLVALHQDLSIPVAERTEALGYAGWSKKDGRLFVQPPLEVLEQSVAVRVHLDASDEDTGALKVVPRSHSLGRLRPQQALAARDAHGERSVPVPRGGLMLMRPLLLHASSKVIGNARRGVLHFLFGPPCLPGGVQWPQPKHTQISRDVCSL